MLIELPSLFNLAYSLPPRTISSDGFLGDHEEDLTRFLLLFELELFSYSRNGVYDSNMFIEKPKVRGP